MESIQPKKLALLRVLQILWERTDAGHPLRLEQIVTLLAERYDITVERKAVGRDIALLREADFEIANDGRGYYLAARLFEDAELRLLIDSVLASTHVPPRQSKDLIEKICRLAACGFQRHIKNIHSVEEWNKTENKAVFYHIELIDEAIENGKMVKYDYNKYGADKKLHRTSTQTVSPYQLILHNQRYYLMGYHSYFKHVVYHRMDRITNMVVTDKPAVPLRDVPGYEDGIDYKHISTAMPYMYAETPELITLRAPVALMDQIVDWFGKDVSVRAAGEDVLVNVHAAPTAMLYWALQYADSVEIVAPESLRERVREVLAQATKRYAKEEK